MEISITTIHNYTDHQLNIFLCFIISYIYLTVELSNGVQSKIFSLHDEQIYGWIICLIVIHVQKVISLEPGICWNLQTTCKQDKIFALQHEERQGVYIVSS